MTSDLQGTIRPVRDRPTWVAYIQMATFSGFMYTYGATQALLRDDQGTTNSVAALHGTVLALGSLVAAFPVAALIRRFGRGLLMRISCIALILSLSLYTIPGAGLQYTLTGIFLVPLFGTFMAVGVNAFLLDYQRAAGPAALTEANALASLVGLLGPIAVGIGAATFFGWRAGVWAIIAALIVSEVLRGRKLEVFGTRALAAKEASGGRLPREVYWALLIIMCFVGAEFSLVFWGADLLRERCNFGAAAAAASLGAITGGMLVGRVWGSRLAQRIPGETLLKASAVLALASFAVAWTFTFWPVVLAGLALTGLGIAVNWPLGVARAVRGSRGMTDKAAARVAVAGGTALTLAPVTLGWLSDSIGFHMAFLLVPILLAAALVLMLTHPVPDTALAPRI